MTVIYTDQSIESLEEVLQFAIQNFDFSIEKANTLKEKLFERAENLVLNPVIGQQEEYLKHLKEGHRRIIEGHIKIIYKIVGQSIYITDFFDSRQDPKKIKP